MKVKVTIRYKSTPKTQMLGIGGNNGTADENYEFEWEGTDFKGLFKMVRNFDEQWHEAVKEFGFP